MKKNKFLIRYTNKVLYVINLSNQRNVAVDVHKRQVNCFFGKNSKLFLQ